MDYFLAFLGGITCKIYDDLNDNNLLTNKHAKECLKGIQWILLTILTISDFNFGVGFYTFNAINAGVNFHEWNKPYESSLLILYPLLIIYSYPTRTFASFYEIFLLLLSYSSTSIEAFIFTEEYSIKKLLCRIFSLFSAIFWIIVCSYFNQSKYIIKILYYFVGYFLVSSIFQAYSCFPKNWLNVDNNSAPCSIAGFISESDPISSF